MAATETAVRAAANWWEIRQNNRLGYRLMLWSLRTLPPVVFRFLAFPVGFFYWIFSRRARFFSRAYFEKLGRRGSSLTHIISFALNLVENAQAWAGKLSFKNVRWQDDDVRDLVRNIDAGRGTALVISHLGNAQMLKGLASAGESGTERWMSITTISDMDVSAGFNAMLNEINPNAAFHMVNAADIGPDTVLLLQERLERGEVVVIAGDRVGAHSNRTVTIPFLGADAPFPYGVFFLLSLLDVPSYFVFGLRKKDIGVRPEYDMFVTKNPVDFSCGSRAERERRVVQAARAYAAELEARCRSHPYQWYNFFDFWGAAGAQ